MFRMFFIMLSVFSLVASSQEPSPKVHLNHAFVVPDLQTYEEIRDSEFVKQFAVWEERTTHRQDLTYTGFYLYGRSTYFEFLKPENEKAVGGSEIAFGVDEKGGLGLLQKRAAAAGMKVQVQEITRSLNNNDVRWFKSLTRTDYRKPHVGVWTLEYFPTFLEEWNPRKGVKSGVRRADVLARYADVVKQDRADKLMADVADIWYGLADHDLPESLRECEVLNLKHTSQGEEHICSDGEFTLHLTSSRGQSGILAVKFKLQRAVESREIKIGATKLQLQGDTATWSFAAAGGARRERE